MYRTMKRGDELVPALANYRSECPTCAKPNIVDDHLTVLARCSHFVRVWRVTADQRVRIEYRESRVAAV